MKSVLIWGHADFGKPRVRIAEAGLRAAGVSVERIVASVWEGIEDKTALSGPGARLRLVGRILLSYPRLVWRFLRSERPDAVLVCYPGHLDVMVLWPFARLRRVPVVWDVFISAYDTIVEDRELVSRESLAARVIRWGERRAMKCATRVLMDTPSHARYLVDEFDLAPERVGWFPVGVETDRFPPVAPRVYTPHDPVRVLFYGQFIPLHGIETIIRAAALPSAAGMHFTLIGRGQTEARVRALIDHLSLTNVTWLPWVDYSELVGHIHDADVCLGIFGDTAKAGRVIPNKVYQILSSGMPLVTRDSTDLETLLGAQPEAVRTVTPASPEALVAAISGLVSDVAGKPLPFHAEAAEPLSVMSVGRSLAAEIF
ncbi:glycosyltransferase [Halovulum sp. GXIMD14794]